MARGRGVQGPTGIRTEDLSHTVRALPSFYTRIAIDMNFEKKNYSARRNLALSFKMFDLTVKGLRPIISLTKKACNYSPNYIRHNVSIGLKPLTVDFTRCYEFMENMDSDKIMSALRNRIPKYIYNHL